MEYEGHKQHSSSVPRQSSLFAPKASYLEYRNRTRLSKPCERILPLNKSIVSKIEKISQDSRNRLAFHFGASTSEKPEARSVLITQHPSTSENDETSATQKAPTQKSSSFDSQVVGSQGAIKKLTPTKAARKAKHRRRRHMKMQLQFDENNFMDCGNLNDLLSSSSLSSSDSEPVCGANESEHEGDDELTDWPGNEAMINFASKHDFKRAKTRPKLPQIPQMQDDIQDDDTLMSTEDINFGVEACGLDKLPGYTPICPMATFPNIPENPNTTNGSNILPPRSVSMPIDISGPYQYTKQIESEMSGDTSNNILSSPNTITEVREIRAGCRRIGGVPGYSIITPVNEQLARYF